MVMNGKRAVDRCHGLGLAPFSDNMESLYRPYLGPAFWKTIEQVGQWMHDAGMTTRIDAAGNLIGRYEGNEPEASALVIGSHLDSVRNAGRFDGPLGVMLGIECVEELAKENRRLPFAVEVVAFGDEEGSRFSASMMCSRAFAGQLECKALETFDGDGMSLAQALRGSKLSVDTFLDARREPVSMVGYLEAHIEQGPVLENEGLAVGAVTAIAGQLRYQLTVTGKAGHAGTNLMALRKDALAAAAEMVLAVESIAKQGSEDLVATVGSMTVEPGAANVVPGQVVFSLDVRAATMSRRDQAASRIFADMETIAQRRGVVVSHQLLHDLPATPCDPEWVRMLGQSIETLGQPVRYMVSGAGHDAMALAKSVPSVMLFIRCRGGVSHHPDESVEVADVEIALKAMLAMIGKLEEKFHA